MAINKIVYNGGTLIDLTGDTVTADKLMQGYIAHDKTGEIIIGTATGGGSTGAVWQDQDGYVHLSDESGGGGGGSSDLSTAEVTIINSTSSLKTLGNIIHVVDEEESYIADDSIAAVANSTNSIVAVLYKGSQYVAVADGTTISSVSGGATTGTDQGYTWIEITGDCTITIS